MPSSLKYPEITYGEGEVTNLNIPGKTKCLRNGLGMIKQENIERNDQLGRILKKN